jgi:peptidoglycan DL-endopeptidase CwlO
MAMGPSGRQRRLSMIVAILATILAVVGQSPSAYADPGDEEGGTQSFREKLETAARSYYDAKNKLTASQKRQAEITKRLREAQISLVRLNVEVGNIAAARYKGGHIGLLNGLFTGQGEPATLLQGAAVAEYLIWRDDEQLREFRRARDDSQQQQALLDAEVKIQQKQLSELDKQKRAAEKALASVGGMVTAGYSGPVPAAQAAPRTASGGWPRESCSYKDPTGTGGCLTPRMYHTLNEARLAGFTRFTRCWRSQSWGEHPTGRACDFAAARSNFGNAATGADKTYGNRLAAWAKVNAEALGVIYVIWYRQIWMPGIGWRSYSGYGDPSSEHTNHVHISML